MSLLRPAHNPFKTTPQVTPKSLPIIPKTIKRELSFPKEEVPLKKSYVAEIKMEIEEEDIIVGQEIETNPGIYCCSISKNDLCLLCVVNCFLCLASEHLFTLKGR